MKTIREILLERTVRRLKEEIIKLKDEKQILQDFADVLSEVVSDGDFVPSIQDQLQKSIVEPVFEDLEDFWFDPFTGMPTDQWFLGNYMDK